MGLKGFPVVAVVLKECHTPPSQVFRLKGKGLPVLGSSRHGDHYVTAVVEVPKKLSRKEKGLIEEWKKISD